MSGTEVRRGPLNSRYTSRLRLEPLLPRPLSSLPAPCRLVLIAVLGIELGCRLSVPPEIAENADVLLVEDRAFAPGAFGASEEFRLGGRQVSKVDRHGFGLELSVGGVSSQGASGGYTFQLAGQQGPVMGRCATSESGFGAEVGKHFEIASSKANLVCQCGAAARLSLAADDSSDYSGTLELEDRNYEISTTYEMLFPAGYIISAKEPIAVLDNMNPGQRVWITRGWEAEHRDELSCLFASLLLYTPPRESMR